MYFQNLDVSKRGNQSNHNKSISVRTVRKDISNPNLYESVVKKTQTAKALNKSAITDSRIYQKIVHEISQTANDIETQFSKVSTSKSSEIVMSGIKVNKKPQKNDTETFIKLIKKLNDLKMEYAALKTKHRKIIQSSIMDYFKI